MRMSPPPAAALSSSSYDDSSSDEAQYIVQCNPPRTKRDDDGSDSDSGFQTDTDPLTKTQRTEDSSEQDEEEEEREEVVEKQKLPAKTLKQKENSSKENDGEVARSHFYLEGLIKDMISTQQYPRWLSTVEDVVAQIGESQAKDLEAKTKILRMNEIKLHARKEKLMAELFDMLADEMVRD